ncbi:hypothetical protein A4G85_31635 [Burkholderia pseudomallei]|nr:hypothetical protein Y049_506 [Burkholderia pseudomallei MSHR684]OMW24970.1 hypothetical protein AQ806_04510 [Burkholderia pseudomallei]RAQ82829.1 hypothetical protein A4G85_31635 [Burkholderia pseudomallei]
MRYGVIRTQKCDYDVHGGPVHWLRRGTLVRVLRGGEGFGYQVETMYPVFAIPVVRSRPQRYGVREQHVVRSDFYELPQWFGPFLEWSAPRFQRAREWLGWA